MTRPMATVVDPDGRLVDIFPDQWQHVCDHGEMTAHFETVKATITHPIDRRPDPKPGREQYYVQGGPTRWLRVVVSYEEDPMRGRLVTAFGHRNDP